MYKSKQKFGKSYSKGNVIFFLLNIGLRCYATAVSISRNTMETLKYTLIFHVTHLNIHVFTNIYTILMWKMSLVHRYGRSFARISMQNLS